MALVPIRIGEKLRIIETARKDPKQSEIDERVAEEFRIAGIVKRRRYVDGSQYDDENYDELLSLNLDPFKDRLPEHRRRHAYATQIGESVRFIADQLAESFEIEAKEAAVQQVVDAALRLSIQLSGTGEDDDVSIEETLEEAMTAGDVPVELRWDPVERNIFFDLWEAEAVEVVWADRDTIEKVILRQMRWVFDEKIKEERQVEERIEWSMEIRVSEFDDERVWDECEKVTYWDDEEEPVAREWTGFNAIPWTLLRCHKKGLRGQRGESLITLQAMEAADRYNANEQTAYLVARHNSHSNLAVTGDAALLKLERAEHLDKDIDDVLGFPGGTDVKVITLPTNPEMIEHQRSVLAESIYSTFGLTRVEPDTIEGLGTVSGYALEILNRKTEGTFRKIRRHFIRDLRSLLNLTLDLQQIMALYPEIDDNADDDAVAAALEEDDVPPWVDADLDAYPNRDMEIRLGSGYIVDDVKDRDDYNSDVISRREVLRKRGYDDDEIAKIEGEIDAEKRASMERIGGESGTFGRFGGGASRGASRRGSTTGDQPSDRAEDTDRDDD